MTAPAPAPKITAPSFVSTAIRPTPLPAIPAAAVRTYAGLGDPFGDAPPTPGEHVVVLGAGIGVDAFAAAARVGPKGQVVGIAERPVVEVLVRATRGLGWRHLAFRELRRDRLPLPSGAFDRVVVNGLAIGGSRWQPMAAELLRVLRRGGSLAVLAVVLERPAGSGPVPADPLARAVAAGLPREGYAAALRLAGFRDLRFGEMPDPFAGTPAAGAAARAGASACRITGLG